MNTEGASEVCVDWFSWVCKCACVFMHYPYLSTSVAFVFQKARLCTLNNINNSSEHYCLACVKLCATCFKCIHAHSVVNIAFPIFLQIKGGFI